MTLTIGDMALRLTLAVVLSGVIGVDREFKNRPAGFRTHMLVCVGAALVALIQRQIELDVTGFVSANPELSDALHSDPARLIAQVVSGIGFLGAGTIIMTKRAVHGLTTAASLWSVAALGLALGMGYYTMAILAFALILLVLAVFQRVIRVPEFIRIEIVCRHPRVTQAFIQETFRHRQVRLRAEADDFSYDGSQKSFTNVMILILPRGLTLSELAEDLSACEDILRIRTVTT
ncbi:MgtC/SapB family protein [Oscillospiraceae bacterium HV4-5-C5C]|nr:MgtC/SapB family protein [Oscillospiraceae bacterium HV4-5-C5C]